MQTANLSIQAVLQEAAYFVTQQQKWSLEEANCLVKRLLVEQLEWDTTELLVHLRDELPSSFNRILWQERLERVQQGEPVQYIIGYEDFYGNRFQVTPATLIPRPETEELVEEVIRFMHTKQQASLLEIGTGTGCIALSIAKECPHVSGVASDISTEALAVACENAKQLSIQRIDFMMSDVWEHIPDRKYDCIVSNPPYIAYDELAEMDNSVLEYEPHTALFATENGLAIYRRIAEQLENYLDSDGRAFFEIGFRQGEAVASMMKHYTNNRTVWVKKDLSGHDRIVIVGERE